MFYFGNLNGPDVSGEIIAVLQGFAPAASAVLKEGAVNWVTGKLSSQTLSAELAVDQVDEVLLVVALRYHWHMLGKAEGLSFADADGVEIFFAKGIDWVTYLQGAGVLTPDVLDKGLLLMELLGVLKKAPDVSALAEVVGLDTTFCL